MWSNQGITCQRSSGEGTRLYHTSQAPHSRASAASRAVRRPEPSEGSLRKRPKPGLRGFMPDLHRPRGAEQLLDRSDLIGGRRHEYADLIIAVFRIVSDAPLAHEDREQGDGCHRNERAEEDGKLERDDHIWRY